MYKVREVLFCINYLSYVYIANVCSAICIIDNTKRELVYPLRENRLPL